MAHSFNYQSAQRQLREFLESRSLSPNVAWVFAEDIACVNNRLLVHFPLPAKNESAVRALVESAKAQELGVELKVMGRTAECTFCCAIAPADTDEAERMMINGLKLSLPERLPTTITVSGWAAWAWARIWHREPSPFGHLPLHEKNAR